MMVDYKRDILTDKCEFYKRVRRYENCLGMVVGSSEQTGRSHPFYECKAAICYALYQEGYPVSVIGKLMGVNHATVIYRIRQFYEIKSIGDNICSIGCIGLCIGVLIGFLMAEAALIMIQYVIDTMPY